MPLLHCLLLFLAHSASAQYTCNTVMPYAGMQYLTAAQRTQYNLPNPCSFTCLPGYYGDFCAPVPAVSTVPKGPWNEAGFYSSGTGVLQTMTLQLWTASSIITQLRFTSVDSLMVGLSNQQGTMSLTLVSLSSRQLTTLSYQPAMNYMLDAVQVRYGQIFVARAQAAAGPYDISMLTGQLLVGPYGFSTLMTISIRASIIEVFMDKGMNTTFVYSVRNNANTLYACYPVGGCNAWFTSPGVTGVVCGMDCPNAVYVSVSNTILRVTSSGQSTAVVTNGVPSQSTLINCITSIPSLNTILYRTNSEVQQISIGTSQSRTYTSVLTLPNPTTSCSSGQCCSLDASDSNALISLVEYGVIHTVEALQQQCGYGKTSLPIVTTPTASLCLPCPPAPDNGYLVANSPVCAWRCFPKYHQVGSQCVALPTAPCPPYFNALSWGQCQPSAMPWAPGGSYLVSVNAAVSASNMNSHAFSTDPAVAHSAPYILAAGGGMSFIAMSTYLYVSPGVSNQWQLMRRQQQSLSADLCKYNMNNNFYYLMQQGQYLWVGSSIVGGNVQHCLWALDVSTLLSTMVTTSTVTQAYTWTVETKVCSIAEGQNGVVYMLPCEVNYILQTQYTPSSVSGFSILSGQMKAGYTDGALSSALFDAPTSIVYHNQRLYVTDTNNCVLRELDVARGSVSTVAGYAGICQRQDGYPSGLQFPRGISRSAYDGFFLFTEQGPDESTPTVRQFHAGTGYIWTIGASPIQKPTTLLGFTEKVWVISNSTGQHYTLTASTQPCPAGTISLSGNALGQFGCATCSQGFYSQPTRCVQCSPVNCTAVGTRPVQCGANVDSYCGACTNLPTDSQAVYTGPAQSYDGWVNCPWVYKPPCPAGFYKDSTGSICLQCPQWSTTNYGNAQSIAECSCTRGRWATDSKGVNLYTCIVDSPHTSMPSQCQPLSQCPPFTQPAFPFPVIGTCTSAALDSALGVCRCMASEYIAQIFPKICQACPSYLFGDNGQYCERCPAYAEPSLDGSNCRCAGGTKDVDLSSRTLQCVCGAGYGFMAGAGCFACPVGSYNPSSLTLSSTPWLQTQPCIACPLGTWSQSGQSQCTKCPDGMFRDAYTQGCTACPSGRYAPDPTTGTCIACQQGCGGRLQTPCPTNASLYVCRDCPAKRIHSNFNGGDNCTTSCWSGYYEADMQCVQCTAFNSTTCPAGSYLIPCEAYNDASCAPCVNASKPLYNSLWVTGSIDPKGASVSCNWQCEAGYRAKQSVWLGVYFATWSCARVDSWSISDLFTI